MRKPKPNDEKVVNAGVSLPAKFIKEVREIAQVEGFQTLTSLTNHLLHQWLQQIQRKREVEQIERNRLLEGRQNAAAGDSSKKLRRQKKASD
jgi:hypothetical protein